MPTKPRPWTTDLTRSRMQTTRIVKRLTQFALGLNDDAGQKVEMSAAQVKAALGLLKKTLPDLSAVEYKNMGSERPVEEWTDVELFAEIARIRERRAALDAAEHSGESLALAPPSGEVH